MRKSCKKYFCFILLVFIFYSFVNAQSQALFRYLSKKDGLSQVSVFAISQDSAGFLWFGTRDGLNKYDGYQFKVYKNDNSPNSLSSNDVRVIYYDRYSNSIIVGTTKGLSWYRSDSDDFINFVSQGTANSLNSDVIHSIYRDSKGRLWVGTSAGINLYNEKTGQFSQFIKKGKADDDFPQVNIDAIIEDHNGVLWVGSDNGLYYLDESTAYSFVRVDGSKSDISLSNSNINALLTDKNGNMWIGNEEGGLHFWDRKSNIITVYKTQKDDNKSISNNNIRVINEDSQGYIWIGTFDGLNIFDPSTKSFRIIKKTNSKSLGLSDSSVKAIYKDKRGAMWIGTYYGGVNHIDNNFHRFINFAHNPYNNELSADVVSSFAEDHDGNLWIGTEGGGLNFYNINTKKFTVFKTKSGSVNSISGNNVKQLLLEGDYLWIGTFSQGLDLLDIKNSTFQHFKSSPGGLSDNNVYGLLKESNYLWILTYGGGLDIYNTLTKTFRNYRYLAENPKSVSSDLGRVFLKCRNGTLWIGTERGINKVIRDDSGLPIGFQSLMKDEKIYTLHEDFQNNIWIGTISNGLYRYNPNSGEFEHYTTINGLSGNTIYGILEDSGHRLWLSTNFGLSKFDPISKKFTNYNNASGLENTEYNYNAYYKTKSGDMLFGGITGFTRFNPNDIKPNTFIPTIAFTDLIQNNKPVAIGDNSGILHTSLNTSNFIKFKYNEANFTIGFTALDFFSPRNNQYAYMLEGLDNDWNYNTGRTEASYTIQKEGNYLFKVKGANSDGIWNPVERHIEILVLPPPWRSWWADLIYIALITFAIFGLYRYVKLRHTIQLQRVARQQQEELHEVKLRFFTNITHEFRTPLTLILGPLKEIAVQEHADDIKSKINLITKNAQRLLNLVNQVLVFRKLETDHEPLNVTNGNIVTFLKEIFLLFTESARSKNITYEFRTDEDIIAMAFDEEKIEKVFFNLLSNAFKFTHANGKISMFIQQNEKEITVEVKDNGIGINPDLQDQIFTRYYEKQDPIYSQIKGSGIGLAISKQMVELHQGTIDLVSTNHKGSCFRVVFPREIINSIDVEPQVLKNDWSIQNDSADKSKENEGAPFHDDLVGLSDECERKNEMILIIEDNLEVRDYISHIFIGLYQVITSDNGEEGLLKARRHHPDLILSDVMMPVMDGVAMTKILKQDIEISHIPVILLTARSATLYKIEGLTLGADDYITKPFDPEELKLRVRNILRLRKEFRNKFARVLTFDPKSIEITSSDEEFLNKAMSITESNIENYEYSVDQFAYDLAISRPLLFIKLKALTDQTPNNFIKTIRLKRAAQLLLMNKLNVSEVAYKVGFKDPKYFRKCFQSQFDISPSDYPRSDQKV